MLDDKIEIIKVFKGGSLSSTKLINHPEFNKCILKKVSNNSNREYGFVRFCSQIKRHSQLQSYEPKLFPEILEVGIDIESKQAYSIYKFMEEYISIFDFLDLNHVDLDYTILSNSQKFRQKQSEIVLEAINKAYSQFSRVLSNLT